MKTKMAHRNVYTVGFRFIDSWDLQVSVSAGSKKEAWNTAVYETIPNNFGELPYAAWVESVTYQNGNYKKFVPFEQTVRK